MTRKRGQVPDVIGVSKVTSPVPTIILCCIYFPLQLFIVFTHLSLVLVCTCAPITLFRAFSEHRAFLVEDVEDDRHEDHRHNRGIGEIVNIHGRFIEDPFHCRGIIHHAVDGDTDQDASAEAVVEVGDHNGVHYTEHREDKIEEYKIRHAGKGIDLCDLDGNMPERPHNAQDDTGLEGCHFLLKPGKGEASPADLFHQSPAVEKEACEEDEYDLTDRIKGLELK